MVSVTAWWTRPYVCVVVVVVWGVVVISANKTEFEGDVKGLPYVV